MEEYLNSTDYIDEKDTIRKMIGFLMKQKPGN